MCASSHSRGWSGYDTHADSIVRGLRAVTDFELEFQQALMNRKLAPEIETLMIITDIRYLFVSATLLKEVARLGGDLDGIVTTTVANALKEKLATTPVT